MLIFLPNSCRGQISTTIELEKSFPGDHFAEKIILTTDFSGIINTKFPQGLIWRFINHNSNQKWASNQKGGVHIVCQYCYLSRTKWLKFWLRLRIFDWLKNFWVQIFFESVRMRIFDWLSQRFLSPNMGISFCRPWIEACHGFLCKIERYADPRGAQNIWLICCLILAGQFEKVHFPKHKLVSYS